MVWNPFKRRKKEPQAAAPPAATDGVASEAATGNGNAAPSDPGRDAASAAGATSTAVGEAPAQDGTGEVFIDRPVEQIEHDIVNVLRTIYDPEVPVDIYELGLIYGIEIGEDRHVDIRMTLTSPACPVAGSLPPEVEHKVAGVDGVRSVTIDLTWDPPWGPDRMSESARLQLGL